ncbi:MAG TPA: hypothetical protein VNZ52_10340, partial [Candidatus Thermoplasmatota archaeon]|nr:hypothetical protein [Candidatus Thermoplasmatota archaeon]
MRSAAVLALGLLLLAPTVAAQLPGGGSPNAAFMTPLTLTAGPLDRALPATGEPVTIPLTIRVACAGVHRGPVALAVVSGPAWLTLAFQNGTQPVPSDPRSCSGDGYYTLQNAVALRASPGVPGGRQDNVTLTATREDAKATPVTFAVTVEAASRLVVTSEAPGFLLPEDTREARGFLVFENTGNLPLDVRVSATAPPSVLVDGATAPRRLDAAGSGAGSQWRLPVTVRAGPDRDEAFTVRFQIEGTPVGSTAAPVME